MPLFLQEPLVKLYPFSTLTAMPAGQRDAGGGGVSGVLGFAPVIALRVADLVPSAGRLPGEGDRTALVVAGTPVIRAGDQLVFVKVVAVAPAVVRRDGRIQAGGHPADHARLGAIEQQLDDLLGPGVIDEIAAEATLAGKVKGKARRAMTAALTIRASVLMGLAPGAGYAEVMSALLGDLVLVPWQRPYQAPTAKVLSTWRAALGPAPLAGLQARLLAAVSPDARGERVGDVADERAGVLRKAPPVVWRGLVRVCQDNGSVALSVVTVRGKPGITTACTSIVSSLINVMDKAGDNHEASGHRKRLVLDVKDTSAEA